MTGEKSGEKSLRELLEELEKPTTAELRRLKNRKFKYSAQTDLLANFIYSGNTVEDELYEKSIQVRSFSRIILKKISGNWNFVKLSKKPSITSSTLYFQNFDTNTDIYRIQMILKKLWKIESKSHKRPLGFSSMKRPQLLKCKN